MNEINDCIATGAKLLDNLKLVRWLAGGGTVGDQTNGLALEEETIADNVTWSENVLCCLRGDGMGGRVVGDELAGGNIGTPRELCRMGRRGI